jgi:hypothetical protein
MQTMPFSKVYASFRASFSIHRALPIILPLLFSTVAKAQIVLDTTGNENYRRQGEYYGMVGDKPYGIQVIDFSGGKFEMDIMPGGLPGQGWGANPANYVFLKSASSNATSTVFAGSGATAGWTISIPAGGNTLTGKGPGNVDVVMKKVYRQSSTLGIAPPAGATILFNGNKTQAKENWGNTPQFYDVGGETFLKEGSNSTKNFADHTLHIEFRPPYRPDASGQERGNSGVYVQGSYECQVLDSFGWMNDQVDDKHKRYWAGDIYGQFNAKFNMAHPPLTWSTYDIRVTNAVLSGANKAPAHLTVYLNGILVQDVDVLGPTAQGKAEKAEGGALFVQSHGNPMWYRNIWILPGKVWPTVPALTPLEENVGINWNKSPRSQGNLMGKARLANANSANAVIYNLVGSRLLPVDRTNESNGRNGTGQTKGNGLAAGLYFVPAP